MPVNTQNQFSTTIPSSPLTNRLGVANAGVGVSTHEPNNQSFEMFSFTFSPELLNLFWGLYKGNNNSSTRIENVTTAAADSSTTQPFFIEKINPVATAQQTPREYYLFGFHLPIHDEDGSIKRNVLSIVKHSVITTGIVILVGFGSYCTYLGLLKLRNIFVIGCEKDSLVKQSLTSSSSIHQSTTSWWPIRFYNNYCKPQFQLPKKRSKEEELTAMVVENTSSSLSNVTENNYTSTKNIDTIKSNLTLDLEKKNGKAGKASSTTEQRGGDSSVNRRLKLMNENFDKNFRHRPEGEHFSPSPVLSNMPSKSMLKNLENKEVRKEERILIGGEIDDDDDDSSSYPGEDEEFQIEYFGPRSTSSSSTLSDTTSDTETDNLDKLYKKHTRSSNSSNNIPFGTTIQTMISPIHNKPGPVRRKLDFGDTSPVPPNTSPSVLSAASTSSSSYHHHLPPLSASSSMSLSPSTPTTNSTTSTTPT